MLILIPAKSVPNQSFTVQLNNQNVTIDLLSRSNRLYMNVYLGSDLIISGMACVHAAYINQYATLPHFVGKLFWLDDNAEDPTYTTLETTSKLYYADYNYLSSINV